MQGVAAQRIVHPIRKPRNNADEAIAPKPEGMGLSGLSALSRRSPMEACHGLRVASCISSRKSRRRGHAGLIQRFLSLARLRRAETRAALRASSRARLRAPTD